MPRVERSRVLPLANKCGEVLFESQFALTCLREGDWAEHGVPGAGTEQGAPGAGAEHGALQPAQRREIFISICMCTNKKTSFQASALICLPANSKAARAGAAEGERVVNAPGRFQRHFKAGMWSGEEAVFNADLFLFELVDAYFKLLWHTVISGLLVFLCQSQP